MSILSKSVVRINAEPGRVWKALTDPELVKKWQYGADLVTDWKIGSKIVFKCDMGGTVYEQFGTVLEFIANEFLSYNLLAPRPGIEDRPENYFVMQYALLREGKSTVLTIIQEDNRPGSQEVCEESNTEKEENNVLNSLKDLVENM